MEDYNRIYFAARYAFVIFVENYNNHEQDYRAKRRDTGTGAAV